MNSTNSRVCVLAILLVFLHLPPATAKDAPKKDKPTAKKSTPKRFYTSRKSYRPLKLPTASKGFTFAVLGDRTGGRIQGLKYLKESVRDINVSGPDLVMTVGDLIQGYNRTKPWMKQMRRYRGIMDKLKMPWFPVAGNHDIYWRGKGKPKNEHEGNYEKHFGPLWYAFVHHNCWFIVLHSDEGDPKTGKRGWKRHPARQKMSARQHKWLKGILKKAKGADHVFVFLHHPRWLKIYGYGNSWEKTHQLLKSAGNVTAVFAGHIHAMTYAGKRDGIEYFTLATTGGSLAGQDPSTGIAHHYLMVTVRKKGLAVVSHPTGKTLNPRKMPPLPVKRPKGAQLETLVKTKFRIHSPETRDLHYIIEVPKAKTKGNQKWTLLVAITGAADNTGDRGLNFRLLDSTGMAVRQRKVWRKGTFWVRIKVRPGSKWTLVLADHDTSFTGKQPGNGGNVRVMISRQ